MGAPDPDWEELPSYYELARSIYEIIFNTYREICVIPRELLLDEITWKYNNFTLNDISLIFTLPIIWAIWRHLATERIFKPLGHHFSLTPRSQKKMPESAWAFAYYLCAWTYNLYVIILSGTYRFFQKPSTVWDDWNLEAPVPMDIYFLYFGSYGYCLHSLYATLYVDSWKKDSCVMIIHHVVTLLLMYISYSLRYHNIGCLVLFTHDVCDILLEFTKLNVYFKIQNGIYVKIHDTLANISFFLFTIVWCVTRLYWFPLKVLYTSTTVVQRRQLVLPCFAFLNLLLWILLIIHLYWSLIIFQLLYRVVSGKVKQVDDSREYDVEEKFKRKKYN